MSPQLVEHRDVDIVGPGVRGAVFAELIERLSRKDSYPDVKGILFHDSDGNVVIDGTDACSEGFGYPPSCCAASF